MSIKSLSNQLSRRQFIIRAAYSSIAVVVFPVAANQEKSFTLISSDEYASELENGGLDDDELIIASKSQFPSIDVQSPTLDESSITSPVDIVVQFRTSESETIDMKSLRIKYGIFMDVTDRILKHAELGADYVKASNAELPEGKHKFTIIIKDSAGREAKKTIKVTIA